MTYLQVCLAVCGIALIISPDVSRAQPPNPPTTFITQPAPTVSAPMPTQPTVSTRINTWTRAQWAVLKRKWSKDQEKWSACVKQAQAKKLSIRKSNEFLWTCMQR